MRDRLLSRHWVFLFLVCFVVARVALGPLHAVGSAVGWTNGVNYLLDTSLLTVGATIPQAMIASVTPTAGGGFLEKAGSQTYRSRFTASQIASFLPASGARGTFTFPPPYNTTGIRLTNANDCAGGQDCLWYVGYSYWRNINNHVGSDTMYIVLGFDRNRGGAGPSLLAYNKITDAVQNVGPLFTSDSTYSYSTAEGWYFSATMPTRIYTFLPGGAALRRYDVLAHAFESTPALDLTTCPRPAVCPTNAAYIWQPHSSDDDAVHSVTVQDVNYQRLGCAVSRPAGWVYAATRSGYALDECHVDKSGRWLVMLEASSSGALDNRIVDLSNGSQTTIADAEGALGHLDMGFGYAVGADNYNPLPNASILVKFPPASTTRPVGPVVHYNKRWDIVAANHIAHGNAVAGRTPEEQYACGSAASRVTDMADEIVCFSLNSNRNGDGSLDVLVVTQVMTDLNATGGGGGDYEKMPKGNLDVTGRYFIWTTNLGGNRLDAFLVKVPADLLSAGNDTPIAATKSATTAAGTAVAVTLSATDVETCELAFSMASAPAHGTLSASSDVPCAAGSPNTDTAQVTYTPNPGFSGTDTFTYRASDGTATSAAATVTITVAATQTSSTSHVGDLDRSAASLGGGSWRGSVNVQVHDANHAAVAGATVAGTWTGGYSGSRECITDNTGRCTVSSGNISNGAKAATFTVTAVQPSTLTYNAAANHDPDGDSNGTSIAVRKP